jgi:RNA polymerase sigma-70 factor (ECF subfamily)
MKCKDDGNHQLDVTANSSEKDFVHEDTYKVALLAFRRLIVQQDLAQDVLLDTFIKANNILGNSSKTLNVHWLYRIATNEALQQLAKIKTNAKNRRSSEYYMQNLVAQNAEHDAEAIKFYCRKPFNIARKQKLVSILD